MVRYLIIAETTDTGYFVEFHTDLKYAMERAKLFFNLAFQPGLCNNDLLDQQFSIIASYPIYEQHIILEKNHGGSCNGFCSTDVIEVDENFDLKRYALLRASAQCAFNSEEHDRYFDFMEENEFSETVRFWGN